MNAKKNWIVSFLLSFFSCIFGLKEAKLLLTQSTAIQFNNNTEPTHSNNHRNRLNNYCNFLKGRFFSSTQIECRAHKKSHSAWEFSIIHKQTNYIKIWFVYRYEWIRHTAQFQSSMVVYRINFVSMSTVERESVCSSWRLECVRVNGRTVNACMYLLAVASINSRRIFELNVLGNEVDNCQTSTVGAFNGPSLEWSIVRNCLHWMFWKIIVNNISVLIDTLGRENRGNDNNKYTWNFLFFFLSTILSLIFINLTGFDNIFSQFFRLK